MRFLRQYLIPRLLQYGLVVWLGVTVVFFLPRMVRADPVEQRMSVIMTDGAYMDPAALKATIATMRQLYGLEAGLFEQYLAFWRRLFTGDFGPSLYMFPTPVISLIGKALPWTVGLLLTSTLLSWTIGNITGGLSGYFAESRLLRVVDSIAMGVRPIPYYVMALMVLIVFAYLLPIFPVRGGYPIGVRFSFTWGFIRGVLTHASLPVVAMVMLGTAVNHQTMRLIIQGVKGDDCIRYAKLAGVPKRVIFSRYAMKNAILPQVTALAMSLGGIFTGSLITEIVFAYPGMGYLLFEAVRTSDYNLVMGIFTISIVAIATAVLLIDLVYPLIDPRIRFR